MSLPDSRQTSQVCPRCKIALSLNQIVCTNCGFSVAYLQSGNPSNNPQIPASGGGQFRGIVSPSSRPPESSAGQGSSLGISQFRGGQGSSLGISQFRGDQGSSLGVSQSRGDQVPSVAVQQTREDRVPSVAMQQARGGQIPLSQSREDQVPSSAVQQARGDQDPLLAVSQTREGQVPTSTKSRLSSASKVAEEKPVRKHATLLYFTTVVLVFVIVAVTGLHAAGISLATLAPRGAAIPAVGYALPKVAPLFADTFANDASGWNLQSSPGSYQVAVGNGTLAIEVNKNKLLWEPLPGAISYSDFTLTVNAILAQGDQNNGYGLYIRGAPGPESDLDTYYRFELYGDASYAIFKGIVDQNGKSLATKVVNYTLSPAIQKQGKLNHIMLIARGDALSFIVNGQLLKTFIDTSYASGTIALFASNLPGAKPGVQVQFSQLALYPRQVVKPS